MKLELERRSFRLSRPLQSSYGPVHERELILVTLTGEDGVPGYGEAAPLEPYDGVSIDRVQRALERYRPVLAEASSSNGAQLMEACRQVEDLPAALAAIDLALWDRAGRRAQLPVAALLTDDAATHVPVNATLSSLDRAGAAEEAARAVREGFQCLKLKVGVGDDAGRVAATRAAGGPQVALRLDANGAWGVEEAIAAIEALSPAGLELVEEPTHGLQAMREVRDARRGACVDRRDGGRARGPDGRRGGRGLPEDLPVRRDRRTAGGGGARARHRRGGVPRLDARRAAGRGGGASRGRRAGLARTGAALRSLDMGLFAEIENPLPAKDGAIELPDAPGLGVQPF